MDQSLQNSLFTALYIIAALVTIGISFWQIMKIPKKIWRIIIIFSILMVFVVITITLQMTNVIFKVKPNKPELLSPIDKYISLGEGPELAWKGDDNSVAYYVNINSSSKKDINSEWITSNYWKTSLPNEDNEYFWKVKAFGKSGLESEWSEERSFSTKLKLFFIGEMTLISRSDNEVIILASTDGKFGSSIRAFVNDAKDGTTNGEWILIAESGFPEFSDNNPAKWNTAGWPTGIYKIRVEARGPNDPSWEYSTVIETTYEISKTTYELSENISINRPTLLSPANGALISSKNQITLWWSQIIGAEEYLVEIWGGQYGSNHNTLGGWQYSTSKYIDTMSPGNVMWRVKARNSLGVESAWSDIWNFTPQ